MMMPPEKTVHPWLAHLSGLTAIRRARYKEPSRSFSGVGLFLTLDDSPDKSARGLIYDTPVDDWFIDNSTRNERLFDSMFVTRHGFEPPPSTDRRPAAVSDPVNDLNARTQNILQPPELSIFESSDPQAREKVKALLAAARSQLSSFRDWPARLPDGWQPKAIPTTHLEPAHLSHELDLYPGRIDIYPSCQYHNHPIHAIYPYHTNFTADSLSEKKYSIHRSSMEHLPHDTITTLRPHHPMWRVPRDGSLAVPRDGRIPESAPAGP